MVLSGSFMVHFGSVGSSLALWTLIVCLSSAVWTSSEGQPRVVGSLQPIVAVLGDDIVLPCRLQPSLNVEGLTVEWSRPDLKPDPSDRLSRVDYVHLHRDRREDTDMKLWSYVGRTELSEDGLKSGDISLKILNVTLEDGGRYRCFLPKLKGPVKDSVVTLVVEPNSVQTTTETPLDDRDLQTPDPNNETNVKGVSSYPGTLIAAVVVLLVLVGGIGGYLLKQKKQQEVSVNPCCVNHIRLFKETAD